VDHQPHRFEDFTPGQVFTCSGRRITRQDIAAFAEVSGDHTALHCDDSYAATTPFGSVVSHGALNLAAATGLAYGSGVFEGTVLAILSISTRFERPVFPGDELALRMTVRELDARPRPDRGRVAFYVVLSNQAGKAVLSGDWTLLVRRAAAPAAPAPIGKQDPPD
jgi:acyl dehydratase